MEITLLNSFWSSKRKDIDVIKLTTNLRNINAETYLKCIDCSNINWNKC